MADRIYSFTMTESTGRNTATTEIYASDLVKAAVDVLKNEVLIGKEIVSDRLTLPCDSEGNRVSSGGVYASYGTYTGSVARDAITGALGSLWREAAKGASLVSGKMLARYNELGAQATPTDPPVLFKYSSLGEYLGSVTRDRFAATLNLLPGQAAEAHIVADTLRTRQDTHDDGTTTTGYGQRVGKTALASMTGTLDLIKGEADALADVVSKGIQRGAAATAAEGIRDAHALAVNEARDLHRIVTGAILKGDGETAGGHLGEAFKLFSAESLAAAAKVRAAVENQGATIGEALGNSVATALTSALTGDDSALVKALATGLSAENLDLSTISSSVAQSGPRIASLFSTTFANVETHLGAVPIHVNSALDLHEDGTSRGTRVGRALATSVTTSFDDLETHFGHVSSHVGKALLHDDGTSRGEAVGEKLRGGLHGAFDDLETHFGHVPSHVGKALLHDDGTSRGEAVGEKLRGGLHGAFDDLETHFGHVAVQVRGALVDADGSSRGQKIGGRIATSFADALNDLEGEGAQVTSALRTTLRGQGEAIGRALGESVAAALREAMLGERDAMARAFAETMLAEAGRLPKKRAPTNVTARPGQGPSWAPPVAAPAPTSAPPRPRLVLRPTAAPLPPAQPPRPASWKSAPS